MFMPAMSMSVRAFRPLIRVVVFGAMVWPVIAAMPPSTVIVCTIVTSARTTAEHTANTANVDSQRFIGTSIKWRWIVSPAAGDGEQDGQRDLDVSGVAGGFHFDPFVG